MSDMRIFMCEPDHVTELGLRDNQALIKKLRDRVFALAHKEDLTNGDLIFLDLLYEHMNESKESANKI